MTRSYWPESLDDVLNEPVEPHCPPSCVFRELCPTHIQEGINRLFIEGRYVRPSDCLWWQRMEVRVKRETGVDVLPETVEELRKALRRARPMREPGED